MFVRAKIGPKAMELGHKRHRGKCAIAYALADAHPDYRHINVDRDEIRFSDIFERTRYCFATPPNLSKFIDDWDKGTVPDNAPPLILRANDLKWVKPMHGRTPSQMVGQKANPEYKPETRYVAEQKIDTVRESGAGKGYGKAVAQKTSITNPLAATPPKPRKPASGGRKATKRELVLDNAS